VLASVLTLGSALPAASALAVGQTSESGLLSNLDQGGQSAELLQKLTLPQLAALLGTTPTGLVSQLGTLSGDGELTSVLSGLAADPSATVQDVINELTATGMNAGVAEQLLSSLLTPSVGTSAELQSVLTTILGDLASNGDLATLAAQLGVPVATLEALHLLPVSDKALAETLGTSTDNVNTLLESAGGTIHGITPSTALVTAPALTTAERGTTDVVGVPSSQGGITLTTVNSTTPGETGPSGSAAANAFSIASIRITKAGLIVETVKLPQAGRVAVSATTKAKVAGKGHAKGASRAVSVRPFHGALAAGTRSITLHPSKELKGSNRFTVSVTTSYRPAGGSPITKRTSISLKRPTGKTAHKKR
jgi:hypothetical protein